MSEADDLRARAERCRRYAKAYASEVGDSLVVLAVELDRKADRLDAKSQPQQPPSSDDAAMKKPE